MVMKVGVLGYNEGNGHPFSFSAIINGYDVNGFTEAGWPVILNYLQSQSEDAFDFDDVEVTHAWTQDSVITQKLCKASKISHAVNDHLDMLGKVDVVIIARDDYETHLPLAKPFLEHGTAVFIDKPLTLDMQELTYFEKFLMTGQLMSTSGMRYAKELDPLRNNLYSQQLDCRQGTKRTVEGVYIRYMTDDERACNAAENSSAKSISDLGELKLIEGVVLNNLEKYGIHLLDAVAGLGIGKPLSILRLPTHFESYQLQLENNVIFNLSCMGEVGKTFHLSFYGTKAHQHFDLHNNFTAFKRTLKAMVAMVKQKSPPIEPIETINTMKLIYKAKTLQAMEAIVLTSLSELPWS